MKIDSNTAVEMMKDSLEKYSTNVSIETAKEIYETVMACTLTGLMESSAAERTSNRMLEWLASTDFYTAPASTQYHDAFEGGLVKHSLSVAKNCLDVVNLPKFANISLPSFVFCALVHDWCKIGLYEKYLRNVQDAETGKWSKVPSFKINQTGLPLGHGITSMYLATRFRALDPEEALAIRWHMGRYDVADYELNELFKANESYPLVLALQIADSMSAVAY